jgi:hypothetical protein
MFVCLAIREFTFTFLSLHASSLLTGDVVPFRTLQYKQIKKRVTNPYGRILEFLGRSRYYFFQAASQLYTRG